MKPTRKIAIIIGVIYFSLSAIMFRNVIANIPLVLSGQAVINGDELVPFFNPQSQLIEQAEGKFNQLTNGYEFRVRYAFLTTWVRYYKVLPFAIVLVIPGITYLAYLVTAAFLARVLTQFSPVKIYILTAAPVLMIFLVMTYAKITHFYTLILGFSLFLVAAVLMTDGLIFPQKKQYKPIIIACLITLFNPAVHYLVLFGLYMALSVVTLILVDAITVLQNGSWRNIYRWRAWKAGIQIFRKKWKYLFVQVRFWRCIGAFLMLAVFTLAPYGAFVKFYALRGVENLSETVPADYYFIQDASISLGHVLAFDMAGIMDKELTGDYLAKEPRWANLVYMALMLIPLLWKRARTQIFINEPLRLFMIVVYTNTIFSMWATLGYSDPSWGPTFHRTISAISNYANGTQSVVGDLVTKLLATVVQVLRFPHRFELIMFMMACVLVSIGLIWAEDALEQAWNARPRRPTPPVKNMGKTIGRAFAQIVAFAPGARKSQRQRKRHQRGNSPENGRQETGGWDWQRVMPIATAMLFLLPLFSVESYRHVFFSGDFDHFLTPYPVGPLKEVKEYLLQLPPGKTVVLPPTETAKTIVDINGIEHKFIDKFHIYYLDLPSYYYGLTGDSDNKHEFFLLLRAIYYEQPWWLNIARDLNLRYIVINKELVANPVGGQEYLREVERILIPEIDRRSEYVRKLFENESYVLYEFTDLPQAGRVPLYIDTDWNTYIQILSRRPDLTRYYDLRYPMVVGDLEKFDQLTLISSDLHDSMLNLYLKSHPSQFFKPVGTTIAFNSNMISSSYYLSPMFRLFQFFSDSKYNRLNMITPGLWGTITGGFIGIPRPTQFRVDVKIPEGGQYHLLMRGAASVNELTLKAKFYKEKQYLQLGSKPANLGFFDKRFVFSSARKPLDPSLFGPGELGRLIPENVVVINAKYQYFDLGTFETSAGNYTLYFDKLDAAPLLVEGLLLLPEDEYESLTLPENVQLVKESDLCCGPVVIEGQAP